MDFPFHARGRSAYHLFRKITLRTNHQLEPGLHLHTSNRLEILADHLAAALRTPLPSPFASETVVVQSQGMARWLKLELARRHGICANIQFPFPNALGSEIFLALFPGLPPQTPYQRDTMLWVILKRLPALLDRPEFESLRHYLGDRSDERKRF